MQILYLIAAICTLVYIAYGIYNCVDVMSKGREITVGNIVTCLLLLPGTLITLFWYGLYRICTIQPFKKKEIRK